MTQYDQSRDFDQNAESIDKDIIDKKGYPVSVGWTIVYDVPEDKAGDITDKYKEDGYSVSDLTISGRIAIVWDDIALEGFKKSGYVFDLI